MRLSVLFRSKRGVPSSAAPRHGSSSLTLADSKSCRFRRSVRRLHRVFSTVCRTMVKELSFNTAPHSNARQAAHVVVASQPRAGWLCVMRLWTNGGIVNEWVS